GAGHGTGGGLSHLVLPGPLGRAVAGPVRRRSASAASAAPGARLPRSLGPPAQLSRLPGAGGGRRLPPGDLLLSGRMVERRAGLRRPLSGPRLSLGAAGAP